MTNIELYIDGVLTDTPNNFNIRLNRQLINPAELNTKDAQYSFNINLPPTANNNRALGFANVEEIKGKFIREYRAQLIINSVRIFIGLFRLSKVDGNGYSGNLYVPAVKSIKDIFGDVNLNALPEYRIPFTDFASSVTAINTAALTEPQMAIFPYVLYGLLPKVPLDRNANNFSARNLWDDSVRIKMQDIPPSINPLKMLKHIFNSQGYNIGGSAFNDSRLTQIYESYRNPQEYVQPWNFGRHGVMELSGRWDSRYNQRGGAEHFEKGVNQTSDRGYNIYTTDLFDSTNTVININQDPGANILYKEVNDNAGSTWAQTQVRVPASGYYKVRLLTSINVNAEMWRITDQRTGIQHIGGDGDKHINNFANRVYEIKLLRDRKGADFGLSNAKLDGGFYDLNQPQNTTFDGANIPKYFPQVPATGQINMIDQAQNRKHVLGFGFGSRDYLLNFSPGTQKPDNMFLNPRDSEGRLCQMQMSKPGISWDSSEELINRIATKNPGYWKYGRIGTFDNEGDNPDIDIDYSGGARVTGKVLDLQGNPADPDPDNLNTRTTGVYLSDATGFQNFLNGWEISEFIDVRNFLDLKFSAEVNPKDDAAVLVYYDENKFFIGVGIEAPSTGVGESYTNSPITYPAGTVYIRLCASVGTLSVSGADVTSENIILQRFPLQRFYTYTIDGGAGYTGRAFLHEAGENAPRMEVQFIDGIATFNTLGSIFVGTPLLSIYLKTSSYDVDGSLTIDRVIDEASSDVIGWELTDRYKIEINGAPDNYVYRNSVWQGNGSISAVVWLDAGELLTVATSSEEGFYRRSGMHTSPGMTRTTVDFSLRLEPYRTDMEWLKIDFQGHGTAVMSWSDPINFDMNSINLVGFMPSDQKANDYIDNIVKAFNLKLTQVRPTSFSLDVKQAKMSVSYLTVNLDDIASINGRANTPLGLPGAYKIGFTVNADEEGYFTTNDDGGGEFSTGSASDSVVEQKSSFSFNWFKEITKVESSGNVTLQLPVISKREAWVTSTAYDTAMSKRYVDLPQRFWYMDGLLPGTYKMNGVNMSLARVSNVAPSGESILNYKNNPKTLLTNYFTLIGIGSDSHYTEAEAYLSPVHYSKLDGSYMVTFNGDLYFPAEIEGYDPTGKNKTKIKLIRRI